MRLWNQIFEAMGYVDGFLLRIINRAVCSSMQLRKSCARVAFTVTLHADRSTYGSCLAALMVLKRDVLPACNEIQDGSNSRAPPL